MKKKAKKHKYMSAKDISHRRLRMPRRRKRSVKIRYRYPKRTRSHRRGVRGKLGKLGLGSLMNWKNTLIGTGAVIAARKFNPFGGEYKPEVDMIAAGLVSSVAGFDNSDLTTAGAKLALAHVVDNYLLGGKTYSIGGMLGL